MKKILFIALAAITLAACNQDLGFNKPIVTPTEEKDPVTNDFTLIKACIGMSQTEAEALLVKNGYTAAPINMYTKYEKTEEDITKEIILYAQNNLVFNISLTVHTNNQFEIGRPIFVEWMSEIRKSKVFPNIVRPLYELYVNDTGTPSLNTPEDLIAAINAIDSEADDFHIASFRGNDIYANKYELSLSLSPIGGVHLQIYNLRVGLPSEEFTRSDLQEKDLHRHILISKIDYMTFRNRGFYALNVTNKLEEGTEIPFVASYKSPGDVGHIRLYYRYTENMLLSGSIIWNGHGQLYFPESFRAGLPLDEGLPFPGLDRIGFINNNGKYTSTTDETELRNIWQTLSKQKEFQHYFANSTKKVAVYLYRPSSGEANPYDAFYIVITEQTGEEDITEDSSGDGPLTPVPAPSEIRVFGSVKDETGNSLESIQFIMDSTKILKMDWLNYDKYLYSSKDGQFYANYTNISLCEIEWPTEITFIATDTSGVYETQEKTFPVEIKQRYLNNPRWSMVYDGYVQADFVMYKK